MLTVTSTAYKPNPYFGTRVATKTLIETASGRWLTRDGIRNSVNMVSKLLKSENGNINLNSTNFPFYFEKVSRALNENYPILRSASREINRFCNRMNDKKLSNTKFFEAVNPLIEKYENKLGKYMDVTIDSNT